MKTIIAESALLAFLAVGCGSAPSDLNANDASMLQSNGPITCSIQTNNGHFLTAVGGGGRTSDVIHTDATRVGSWEKFVLVDSGDGESNIHYGLKTANGHYLTAVSGGGRITDVIHSDATQIQAWEKFQVNSFGGGIYSINTINGHFVTANNGGGLVADTIHTDATRVGAWEKFRLLCTNP